MRIYIYDLNHQRLVYKNTHKQFYVAKRLIIESFDYFMMEINSDNSKTWRQRTFFKFLVDIFIWLSAALPVLYIFLFGTPYNRGFFCDDVTLSYPYKPDTVSSHVLVVGGFTISAFVVVITEVLRCVGDRCRGSFLITDDIFYCLKGFAVFLVGFIIEQLIVQVSKHEMGVLRPNFFDVCKPNFNRTFCPGYITSYTCTGDPDQVQESRQSFPSGHASFSMYVATFFCIYVQHRLEINFSYILKFFVQTGLVVIATMCGLSRIKDHKHHPSDVAAGFLLGISVAVFVYKMVGTKVFAQDNGSSTKQTVFRRNSQECDCSNARFQESHTPLPLLRSDFLNMGFEKLPVTPLLTDSPFSVRRPKSMPVTSCNKTEDV